ncbi:MAG: Uma2 family endonuclease [Bacteroidota bacterium]|nr:Uma2 family endonuclease [Bacteroidota bacterium]
MSVADKIIPHYTVEDWKHWEGMWELIDGHPIAMSPNPIPRHQRVAAEMTTEFILALRKSKCKSCKAYQPMDFIVSEDTILVPDILIVCGKITKKFLDFPPVLVVEILSPSSVLRDRNTKYHLYEGQGVKFFLIVDAEKETIEVHELSGSAYKPLPANNSYSFELEEGCTITPDFSAIFEN